MVEAKRIRRAFGSRTLRTLVVLVLLAAVPAAASAQQRIVGGGPATRDYPFQTYVEIDFGGSAVSVCGGSLVAARFVVTAGHCLADETTNGLPQRIDVAVGGTKIDLNRRIRDPNYSGTGLKRLQTKFFREPNWAVGPSGEPLNDVAVIELPEPVPNAQLRLPRPSDQLLWQPGAAGIAIGWGTTSEGGARSADLLEVAQPIVSDATCGFNYGTTFRADTMICAGGEAGKDTCQGDSGGPLLTAEGTGSFVLAGVTSFGPGCARGVPGMYARDGADPLNGWLRTLIPQVEIDPSVSAPEPGQQVTFSVNAHNPYGSSPLFGGYDHVAWDLDGDGSFTDAIDQPTATKTMVGGVNTIAVQATRGADGDVTQDKETRKIALNARYHSQTAFDVPAITVTEGQPFTLTVTKTSLGTGTVNVTPATGTAQVGADLAETAPIALGFASGEASKTVTFHTVDDSTVEPAETMRIDLNGHTGDLEPGNPGSVIVTIADNDVPPPKPKITMTARSTLRAASGVFKVTLKTNAPGSVLGFVRDRAGHVLAILRSTKLAKPQTLALKLKLTARGRTAIKRQRRVKATVTLVFSPTDGSRALTARKKVKLAR